MARINEIQLSDILKKLPDIIRLNCTQDLSGKEYDVFFCALGFEERCLTIPEQLVGIKGFKCKEAFYFEYSTNVEDNSINRPKLIQSFEKFADSWDFLQCNEDDFTKQLRELLNRLVKLEQKPKMVFDISVCSSALLLSVMKVLFEFDIYLQIFYSEASIYHPTFEEFEKEPEKWKSEEGFGIEQGVGKVIPSAEYPGIRRENPDLIIVFPTFKPERTNAIITDIDESLLTRSGNRIIWIVGNPNMDEESKKRRKDIIRQINNISDDNPSYEICTLNYKKTLEILDQIYRNRSLDYHINISALGSKMQSLGISLFCFVRPEISVYFAIPKEYNPIQYSEGCKETWQINFGDLANIKDTLANVGQLVIV